MGVGVKQKDFCFCTVAKGTGYRKMARQLAFDLQKYAKNANLLVLTDNRKDFKNISNVRAFTLPRLYFGNVYNLKRFILEKALRFYKTAIFIDSDHRILEPIPEDMVWGPGLEGITSIKSLVDIYEKHLSENQLSDLKAVFEKYNISKEKVGRYLDNLYVVTRDRGREKEFLRYWGKVQRYFRRRKKDYGDGAYMGIAAHIVGWEIHRTDAYNRLRALTKHLGRDAVSG